MQVQQLPASVHKELDRYVRRCVWGDSDSVKRIHLVSWEVLCKPKEEGDFGLRKAESMNKAMMAKLCWRLLTQGEDMWAMIVRRKYGLNDTGPLVFKHKQRASLTWRGLEWASDLLLKGLRWRAVDGRRIRLWEDTWLDDKPLQESYAHQLLKSEKNLG